MVAYKAAEKGVILERPDEVLKAARRLVGTGTGQETDYTGTAWTSRRHTRWSGSTERPLTY